MLFFHTQNEIFASLLPAFCLKIYSKQFSISETLSDNFVLFLFSGAGGKDVGFIIKSWFQLKCNIFSHLALLNY